jgi:hypothetical protein
VHDLELRVGGHAQLGYVVLVKSRKARSSEAQSAKTKVRSSPRRAAACLTSHSLYAGAV